MPGEPACPKYKDLFCVDARDVLVLDPQGIESSLIVRRADPFKLQVTLEFQGRLAPLLLCCLCWEVCYCFDVCDYEPDGPPAQNKTYYSPRYCASSNRFLYDGAATEATIPPNFLDVATYHVTAIVKFYWVCRCRNDPQIARPPISAFADGPVIEIYRG